jgi:hypothetical protein
MSVTGTMDPSNYELVNKFDAERAASRAARDSSADKYMTYDHCLRPSALRDMSSSRRICLLDPFRTQLAE